MKFKIGDRVKFIHEEYPYYCGSTGIVMDMNRGLGGKVLASVRFSTGRLAGSDREFYDYRLAKLSTCPMEATGV